jgi:hypothetical protein
VVACGILRITNIAMFRSATMAASVASSLLVFALVTGRPRSSWSSDTSNSEGSSSSWFRCSRRRHLASLAFSGLASYMLVPMLLLNSSSCLASPLAITSGRIRDVPAHEKINFVFYSAQGRGNVKPFFNTC